MSFPKYYVTYVVMDTDAGASPFGHSCLIFSQQKAENSPVEVMDGIGFYSQPSTTTNPFVKGFKQVIGLDVDLQDGHGILKKESMRHLNGNGLHGISFAVTQHQFATISASYQQTMKTEQEVINELNLELKSQGIEPNGYTRYMAEKKKAEAERRPPRLKPFHISMNLTMSGLDSSDSYTCKDHALELLTQNDIIPNEIRDQLISNRATTAFPSFSALPLPPIRLISTGVPEKETSKSTGKVFYNQVWGNNSLYWASPIYTPETTVFNEDAEPDNNYYMMNHMLNRISVIENMLLQRIGEIEEDLGYDKEHLRRLKIQLQRVQNLPFLFNNTYENQVPALLEEKLLKADKVLDIATLSMNPHKLNYSFLIRAYESISLQEALVGFLAIALSAATLLITPWAIGLLIASTVCTARQLHGFYKEEMEFAKNSEDLNQEAGAELMLAAI